MQPARKKKKYGFETKYVSPNTMNYITSISNEYKQLFTVLKQPSRLVNKTKILYNENIFFYLISSCWPISLENDKNENHQTTIPKTRSRKT